MYCETLSNRNTIKIDSTSIEQLNEVNYFGITPSSNGYIETEVKNKTSEESQGCLENIIWRNQFRTETKAMI